ncbi:dolichyl pyrophosphate Man9GlcNAc2 alpha-1,3-glucosyltransferase-like [Dysidea avara]|uniref:dolichyl pyrophosphate Man9GlcNAc2 alpha-1,3-glucosyltransferase-like n=1 Tax=Dysidea avara TaxID=196820 RepID=UPI00331F19FE
MSLLSDSIVVCNITCYFGMEERKVIRRDFLLLCVSAIVAFAVLVRLCVGLSGYSGAGKPPMYGDYEAQRHWMELTINLPPNQWYYNSSNNNLQYWGLDYPPLTAYHSWLCGIIAHHINPEWVALNNSHGYESYQHKLFMRYTVLVADVLLYFSAVVWFVTVCMPEWTWLEKLACLILMLLQPSLIIIDHGHFQYNCISLGLALFGVVAVVHDWDLVGSVAFMLSLNYKQMELYHALPFFFYLLGKSLYCPNRMIKIVKLGTMVIGIFIVCWLPYLSSQADVLQVLHRLFPFSRGLYEDKVANFWCTASVVLKLRQLLSHEILTMLTAVTTLLAVLPSGVHLMLNPTPYCFILALINSSLAFFLFSFQVHEKSILLAVMPVSLLSFTHPIVSTWFAVVSLFSMYPLLVRDGLAIACWALTGIFCVCSKYCLPHQKVSKITLTFCVSSVVGLMMLCAASHVISPPSRLPDLFPVLISGYSCILFLLSCVYFNITQFSCHKTVHFKHSHTVQNTRLKSD